MFKFALAMSAYALAMLGIGYLTFISAPPESNAWTALLVPAIGAAAIIACVVMATRINTNRTLGMIGIHVGLVLPLVMAAGSFARLPGSLEKNRAYFQNEVLKNPDGTTASVGVVTSKVHPTGYQAVGIGSIGTLSVFAFVSVLLLRPKPPAKAVLVPAVPASPAFTPSTPERGQTGASAVPSKQAAPL
jgi:hypothetical protein